jgi:MSHA biogenesis protein MshK
VRNRLPTKIAAGILLLAAVCCNAAETLRDPTRPFVAQSPAQIVNARFSVNAIFVSDDRRIAVVNGQRVKPGDTVGGAKVVEISGDEVRLVYDGKTISVRLASSGLRNQH